MKIVGRGMLIAHIFRTPRKIYNIFCPHSRLSQLESKIRDPSSVASVDSLLDTVTALISDFDHDSLKRLKNIEAYSNRC